MTFGKITPQFFNRMAHMYIGDIWPNFCLTEDEKSAMFFAVC